MRKGYRFRRSKCRYCGEMVPDNHYIGHLRKEHPIVDGIPTYAALPNEKPLPVRKPKPKKSPRRAFFRSVIEYIQQDQPKRLPPLFILHGLRAAGLIDSVIAAWYGVSRQAVWERFRHGKEDGFYRQCPTRSRRADAEQQAAHEVAYPPQHVIDFWREQGTKPEEIALRCEKFASALNGNFGSIRHNTLSSAGER